MKAFRNRVKTTALALVMVACMVASVLTGFGTVEAKADLPQTPVQYADYNQATGEFTTVSRNAYVEVSSESDLPGLTMDNGNWYVFKTTVEITNRITVSGTANIILADGCVFTASKGINVASGSALSIYGQGTINGENSTPGELVATGEDAKAGIGSVGSKAAGHITINGGKITANGGKGAAGIGGGMQGNAGLIEINGGEVTARGGRTGVGGSNSGAGIGCGYHRGEGTIIIRGGKVTATGGYWASGIGGGAENLSSPTTGGSIVIEGGEVTAIGGTEAPGIGGGHKGHGLSIEIRGGKVTATGDGSGAGIGGASEGKMGDITISGGEVTAIGGSSGAGIGNGGTGNGGGSITISGGKVTATGGSLGAGIGCGRFSVGDIYEVRIIISGGMIEAAGGENNGSTKAGIGGKVGDSSNFTFTLDQEMKWFASSSATTGYGETTGHSSNGRYALVYKEHSAFLTASGSAITAKYIDTSGNKQSVNLAVEAPADDAILFEDDASAQAKLSGCDNFNSALGRTDNERVSVSQIEYYNGNGKLLAGGASTAKGRYTAKITVDGVTAAVDYEITKNDPAISVSAATGLAYTGDDLQLITAGSTSGGTLKYRLSENASFDTDIPTGKNAGNYTVYYKVEGNNEYKSSKVYSIDVEIKKANLNLSLTQSGWVKGEQSVSPVLGGNAGNGAATYAYKK